MVAHGLGTALGIDTRGQHIADRDRALDDAAVVAKHRRLHLDRVIDDHVRGRVAQLAGVADLTARFGIERRVVEHDHCIVTGLRAGHRRAVEVDGGDARAIAREFVVAVELRRSTDVFEALRHLEFSGRACLVALARHRSVEAGAVHRDAAFAAHVGRQVERESVGIVQLERGLAVDDLRAAAQGRFENLHPVGDGAKEAFFLLLQHLGRALLALAQLGVGVAHLDDQRRHERVEERPACAQLVAVPDRAARDTAQHVAAAGIAGDNAIDDRERTGADVVGDHFQRR